MKLVKTLSILCEYRRTAFDSLTYLTNDANNWPTKHSLSVFKFKRRCQC